MSKPLERPRRVLVTRASEYIGASGAPLLLDEGYLVRAASARGVKATWVACAEVCGGMLGVP